MSDVRLSRRRWMVDGEPVLVLSGEVHYFRLDPADWSHRLDLLKAAGCDTVATYMPWLVHELPDGSIDLTTGHRDLAGFLDLAAAKGLSVIARPGPFVMAELKNEGIPFRVYREHPEVHPVGWDGTPAPTRDIDYLAPAYLDEVRRWYAEVMPLLASRSAPAGGPVVAVQLDNEIGMLSWVTNTPDLTDAALADFASWARDRWGTEGAAKRLGVEFEAFAAGVRSPEAGSLALHHELSVFQRDRYRRYVEFLRAEAEAHGVRGVPFLINLHGTGEGRGLTYPIGISQLFESYADVPQLTSGSDHYLGDLTVENVADLYVGNAFMAAVHGPDQPLTSLEFEAGMGDYGEDLSRQVPPSALDLKTRLCVAQGNRVLNYYLFAGGYNPVLDEPVGDGNDRIAFTGERHGFAAPVGPEGQLNPSYPVLADVLSAVRAVGGLLADMDEEYDDLALGFVPDHYLTEYCHPGDDVRRAVVRDLERFRGMGSREVVARALLLGGYSFPAVNLQAPLTEERALVLASPSTLAASVQQRLADFVLAGGRLLLAGMLPTRDVDGSPCTILGDALGITAGSVIEGSPHFFPSVLAGSWASPLAEVRVGVLQHLSSPDAEVLVRDVASGDPVAVEVRAGSGRAVVLACDYPAHLPFWKTLLARLDVRPRHTHDAPSPGIVVTSTADAAGRRLLHVLNVGPVDQTFTLSRDGRPLFGGHRLALPARTGRILPLNVRLGDLTLLWSTTELAALSDTTVTLRPTPTEAVVAVASRHPAAAPGATVTPGDPPTLTWPAGVTPVIPLPRT
ncbi:beta-galactosidase [Kribbella amoyensis]|uniref:Beta-galactosidase n=1 Tax=Kribbella amoyensis TaxID=996641 RepID=A0A561BQX8_9ACTN|nr:beta-galactosidase [Kribbella amoyensis]TWD81193.1 beta-galactosidase [Kribbella amoyensis]